MLKPKDDLIRSYALDVLAEVSDQPYINKEKLFSDAMAFYRWNLMDERAEDSLDIYLYEFREHHRQVVDRLAREVWYACFITWFVEQGFHRLPPLTGFHEMDERMMRMRFSSPSFRLPTGEPTETYLAQWVLWSLENPPSARRPERMLDDWCRGLVNSLPDYDAQHGEVLLKPARRFFLWGRASLRTWAGFMEYVVAFLYSEGSGAESLLTHRCVDALFVLWFARNNLDHPGKKPRECVSPPINWA